jgi:hypothetical protein
MGTTTRIKSVDWYKGEIFAPSFIHYIVPDVNSSRQILLNILFLQS